MSRPPSPSAESGQEDHGSVGTSLRPEAITDTTELGQMQAPKLDSHNSILLEGEQVYRCCF
jgi:hypothetical protein